MNEKIIIIEKTARLGREFQESYPEIRDLYREGMSVRQIAIKLNLPNEHQEILARCARAIGYYIYGWDGSRNVPAYSGRIPKEEALAISREHRRKDYIDPKNRKKVSLAGVIARGKTPWVKKQDLSPEDTRPGETETLVTLVQNPEYLHREPHLQGLPNYRLLSQALHKVYPETPQRSPQAVRIALSKLEL